MTATTTEAAGRTIDAGGIRTHYHDSGTGDPVILLHGSGPGVSAWANWQHNISALAQRYRVIAPDIVGFGSTDRPSDVHYSLATWEQHIWSFLDALEDMVEDRDRMAGVVSGVTDLMGQVTDAVSKMGRTAPRSDEGGRVRHIVVE